MKFYFSPFVYLFLTFYSCLLSGVDTGGDKKLVLSVIDLVHKTEFKHEIKSGETIHGLQKYLEKNCDCVFESSFLFNSVGYVLPTETKIKEAITMPQQLPDPRLSPYVKAGSFTHKIFIASFQRTKAKYGFYLTFEDLQNLGVLKYRKKKKKFNYREFIKGALKPSNKSVEKQQEKEREKIKKVVGGGGFKKLDKL